MEAWSKVSFSRGWAHHDAWIHENAKMIQSSCVYGIPSKAARQGTGEGTCAECLK